MQSEIELRKALLPHLFLLLRLPNKESPELQLQQCALLSRFAEFLKRPELSRVPQLNVARQAFGMWADLQSSGRIVPERLAAAISELSGGGHLPLFIRELNVGLLISTPTLGTHQNEHSDKILATCDPNSKAAAATSFANRGISENPSAVISTFPASIPTRLVISSVTAPNFVYPAASVRVSLSSLLKSTHFAVQVHLKEAKRISSSERLNMI